MQLMNRHQFFVRLARVLDVAKVHYCCCEELALSTDLVPGQRLLVTRAAPLHGGASGDGVEPQRFTFQADLICPFLMAEASLPRI